MRCGRYNLDFGRKTFVMGILNVTPDSFSDGGMFLTVEKAAEHAMQMVRDGADIIDVGGESTRPGADPVSIEEELKRVIPVIERISKIEIPVSIDTYKPEVALRALEAGACMLNDINALRTKGMAELAGRINIPVVLMHMQGTPRDMQKNPAYKNIVDDINRFFEERISFALQKGVKKENIILDPGIGFGKTLQDNLEIIRRLEKFRKHGLPILVGPSRKSFIGGVLNTPPQERLEGTIAAATAAVLNGADVIRAHDVKEVVMALKIADAIKREQI